jgi:cephalosporin-C deacetylase
MTRSDPAAFRTAVTMPADFDAFWAATLAEAETIDPAVALVPVPARSTDDVQVFELSFTSWGGVRIAGWYCRPTGLTPDDLLPGLLLPPGYISEPAVPKEWARRGYAAFALATRGKLRSSDRFNPGFPGLLTYNITDRETYSYRGMYVDVWRAAAVLAELPEVDPQRVGVMGGSQGGALSVVAAALRPEIIRCAVVGAPFLACFPESVALSVSWPYREIVDLLREHPERADAVWRTTAYFDIVNLAPRVRAAVLMHLGLADDICPPETGYATFEALAGPKDLRVFANAAHESGTYWMTEAIQEFLVEHLRPGMPASLAAKAVGA